MARTLPFEAAYRQIGKEAAEFAKMVADFPKMGLAEFLKRYPDYDYDGTDYLCRRAEALAEKLNAYAAEHLSGQGREARKAEAA